MSFVLRIVKVISSLSARRMLTVLCILFVGLMVSRCGMLTLARSSMFATSSSVTYNYSLPYMKRSPFEEHFDMMVNSNNVGRYFELVIIHPSNSPYMQFRVWYKVNGNFSCTDFVRLSDAELFIVRGFNTVSSFK